MNKLRYYMAAVAIPAAVLMGSCSTSSFMGLSRSSYVDAELKRMETEVTDLAEMKIDLEEALEADRQLQNDLAKAIEADTQLQADLDALSRLTEDFASQLEHIPEATLRELMEAIETHLGETGDSEIEAAPAETADSQQVPEDNPEPETASEDL